MSKSMPLSELPRENGEKLRSTRWLIWTYVGLLIFEGALRKWIIPSLSTPLLIVRDPVVILIYAFAARAGIFPKNRFMQALLPICLLAMVFGAVAEKVDPAIYLFGLRTDFLHLPLIFVIGKVMNYDVVVKQFEASPEDIINTSAGGAGLQLEAGGGKVRASGTFSFVAGIVCYYAL